MSFAEQVKYVRATLLVSQAKLAQMLGVSFPAINRLATGKLEPAFLNYKKFEMFCKDKNIDLKGQAYERKIQ